jgi:hypothetical protein
LLLAALSLPTSARADDLTDAKALFRAGVAAYTSGEFEAAIQAFRQAYAITPRPGLLFSMAQAHRRQFYAGEHRDRRHLDRAIASYRAYLEAVPTGGRRLEASQALEVLERARGALKPVETESKENDGAPDDPEAPEAEEELPTPPPPDPPTEPTRIMVTSPVDGVSIALDGGPPRPQPLIAEVSPGAHRVTVSAPGYATITQTVDAIANDLVPRHVELEPLPAELVLSAPTSAEVAVDGRSVGGLGLRSRLSLPAGRHRLTVTERGHEPHVEILELERGSVTEREVSLSPTGQRIASYVVLGGAGASLLAGGILAGAAAAFENDADDILERSRSENITDADADSYDAAIRTRNDLRIAAGITFAGGLLLSATGLTMLLLDQPSIPPWTSEDDDAPISDEPPVELELDVGSRGGTFGIRWRM